MGACREQICNRSILAKTYQLQTNLLSAESVLSLLQTLSLNTLRVVMPADYLQRLQMICNMLRPKTGSINLSHCTVTSVYTLLDQSLLVSFDINKIVRFYR